MPDDQIKEILSKLDPKWDGKDVWIKDGYSTCEKAALLSMFGNTWEIETVHHHKENDYQGYTYWIFRVRKFGEKKDWKSYLCEYGWGSCGGCDTLERLGPVEATKMILRHIKPAFRDEEGGIEEV